MVLAVVAVTIIIVFLVPNLLPLFEGTGVESPFILQFFASVSSILTLHWHAFATALCLCLLTLLYTLRTNTVRTFAGSLALQLPIAGELNRQRNSAIFARLLGTLLASDVAPSQALEASANVLQNQVLTKCAKEIRQTVMDGGSLSEALQDANKFCPLLSRFVSIGEATGKLDELLLHYADVTDAADAAVARSSERLMALLTPALTITIGSLVGGLILSVLLAILSVNSLALQ